MLPRELRLRRDQDFRRLRSDGKSFTSRMLVVTITENGLPHNRYGIIVGRQSGNAVQRNRARRLIREGLRWIHPTLRTGYDIALIARKNLMGKQIAHVKHDLHEIFYQAGLVES